MKPNKSNPLFARLFRGNTLVAAVVLSLGAFLSPRAAAESISINFGSNEGSGSINTGSALPAGAIPVAGTYWNNESGATQATPQALKDSTGATTAAAVTWSSANTWRSGSTGGTATSQNGILTKGYLDDGGSLANMTISGVPYLTYNAYVIGATDGTKFSSPKVNGRNYSYTGTPGSGSTVAGTASWGNQAWSNADTLVEGGIFLKVTGLASGQLTVQGGNNAGSGVRGSLAGLQIENTYTGTLSYWDIDGATAGAGGATPAGTWDATAANWSSSALGTAATAAWTPSNAAVFSAGTNATGAYTVQVAGPVTADAVWGQDGTLTLADGGSGVINLTGNSILRGDTQLIVNAPVSATTLGTQGNVTLGSTSNSITGLATITGTTTLATTQSFGSLAGAGTVAVGTNTLTVGGDNTDSQFLGSFSGTGTVSKAGSGRLSIGSNITGYTGTLASNAGVLRIGAGAAAGSVTGTIAANGTVEFLRSDSNTQPSALTGAGTLKFLGTGVSGQSDYILGGGTSGFTGTVSIDDARLRVSPANLDNCASITAVDGGQAWLLAGNHSENYVVNGLGWLEPSGQLGAIRFEANANLTGTLTVASASRLVAWGTAGTVSGTLSGSAALNLNLPANPGTLSFTGNTVGYTGAMTLNAGTLNIGASGLGGSLTVTAGTANVTGGIAGDLTANGAAVTVGGTVGGNVLANAGTTTLNGTVTGNVSVADDAVLDGEGTVAGTLNLGATNGSTLRIKAATAGALSAGTVNLVGTNKVVLESLPTTTGEFTVLSYTTLASGDEFNFDVPDGQFRGNPEVQHDVANSRFTLELDSQTRTWNNARLTGLWNTSDANWVENDNLFFSGDQVVFGNTAAGTVSMVGGLQPLSITFQNTVGNNYIFSGGGINGSTGVSLTGGGNVTFGGANTFTGAIAVNAGVLAMGSTGAFGLTSGVTVANGATVDINGQNPGSVATGGYTYTVQGTGVDGSGAIRNTGGGVASNAGVKSLVLTGNTTVNAVGRFDIGMANAAGAGTVTGNGHTLTKIGAGGIAMRGDASATPISFVAEAGDLWAENTDNALGGATGTVTANGTARVGSYGSRTLATPVTLNSGTSLMNLGGGTGTWTGTITAAGNCTVNAGDVMVIDGTLTGTGNIAKTGGSVLSLQSDATGYSGKWTVNGGALRVENNAALGTATGTNVITMANGTTLQAGTIASQASATIGSATQGITLTGAGDVYLDAGTGNTLTIGCDLTSASNNLAAQNGTVVFGTAVTLSDTVTNGEIRARNNSTISFATGANANVRQIALGMNGQGNTANMNIAAGATITAQRFVTSDGSDMASVINQTGGTFNITGADNTNSTSSSFLLGHWSGSTTYNLSAGTINSTGALLSLGWDAKGGVNFNQSGGTNNLLGINLGNSRTNPATYELTGGRLNIGSGGVTANASKFLKLGGGTLGATADWTTTQTITLTGNVIVDTLDAVNGTTPHTINLSGNLTGTGGLTKSGAGILALGGTGTFTGTAVVNGGILHVSGGAAATGTLRTAAGGALRPGTPGAAGTPTAANLTLDGGSVDFRIGTAVDKLAVTGTFKVESPTAVQAIPLNAISGPFPQTFDVIDYTGTIGGASGFAGLTFGSSNPHLSGSLVNDETNTIIKVQISAADSVVWKGNVDGNWNVNTTSNWVLGSDGVTSSKYYDFDVVRFDDTGIGTPAVTLVGSITPAALTVGNTTGTYVLSGSGIGGGTGLAKSGAGGLVLANNNTFTGTVGITGGRVDVGNGGASGTLGGTGNVTVDTGAILGFNTTTNHTFGTGRLINGGGSVEKSGSGTLEFQGNHGFAGGLTINGGTVLLSSGGGEFGVVSGTVTVNAGGTLSATTGNGFGWGTQRIHTLNLNGGTATTSAAGDQGWNIAVNLGNGGTLASTGAGYYSLGGGSSVCYTGTTTPATISGTIRLREGNADNKLPITVADGASAVDLTISGEIAQAATGCGISKQGAGTLQLTGSNTFDGVLDISAGTVRISRPQHSVVSNAMTGTGTLEHASPQELILLGDGTNFAGTIDANGKVVRLAHDTAGAGAGGTLALEGGTLGLGLNSVGFLNHGTFSGAAMVTDSLTATSLATSASGLHGGIGGNTTIAYEGEIYLTAGQWSFGENVDDAVYVKVDGNVLINDNQWNVPTTGTFNAPADGWYPITLRVQNGGGGNGPVDAWLTAGIGIGIKQGGGSTNVGDYVKFEIGALGTNCRVSKAAGTQSMAGSLALGGGVPNTVDTAGGSLALNGVVTGGAGESLVKTGAGTLSLNAVNTYTGDTVVNAGTVAVNGNSIKDTNKVVLDGGMLNLTGTERVTSLFYGATHQADGTYGATGSGAANIDDTRFSGTGVLVVGAPAGYNAWAATNAPTGGAGDDYDGDGVSNGVEYVLGGSGTAGDLGKLPTVSASAGDLVFSFVRDQDSKTPDTAVQIEVGTSLAAWPNVYNVGDNTAGSSAGVTVTDNGNGTDTVTLTVTKGADAAKFARLKVTIN